MTDTTDDPNRDESADGTDCLLVASTADATGKTALAISLAQLASDRGEQVGYMKPKGTRLESSVGKTRDEDPLLAREVLGLDAEMHDLEPIVYSPTFIENAIRGREDPDALCERVREAFDRLADGRDRMLIEGGGHLDLGGVVELTDPEVADLLDARVLLVAAYTGTDDIDAVLAAADVVGDRLQGVLFNAVQSGGGESLRTDVIPFLEGRDIPVHGVIPYERELGGVRIRDLAAELGAEVLVEDGLDAYVERFSVGAMGADSALGQFRRLTDAVVVTGGDRPELHIGALEAPGVSCLLVTGGHRPPGAVLGRATERAVPVLSVTTDTLTAVERAESIVRTGRARDERSVERMRSLLETHADIEAVFDGTHETRQD